MIITIAIIICIVMTLVGGKLALRFKDSSYKSNLLGFSAGAILSVAFFDLLPEAFSMSVKAPANLFLYVFLGFMVFHILERFIHFHSCRHDDSEHHGHSHTLGSGPLAVFVLSLHSLIDGLMIGISFLIASKVGIIILIAILGHKLCDGINIVSAEISCQKDENEKFNPLSLFINALAPIVGVILSQIIHIPILFLPILLAASAGFFIYLGASDLLPASHQERSTPDILFWTIAGCLIVWLIIRFASGI